jgi:hypothetical protein
MLPQVGCREARLADDVIELASPNVEMQAGAMENPAPLPSGPMRADEERLASERPAGRNILIRLLAGLLKDIEFSGELVG